MKTIFLAAAILTACVADPTPRTGVDLHLKPFKDTTVDISGVHMLVIDGTPYDTVTVTLAHARDQQELWVHNDTTWEVAIADAEGGLLLQPFQTATMIYDASAARWYWLVDGR